MITQSANCAVFVRDSRFHRLPSAVSHLPEPATILKRGVFVLGADRGVVTDYRWALAKAAEAGNVEFILKRWEQKRLAHWPDQWPVVKKAFEDSRQTVLYRLTPRDIVDATENTDHALGNISSAEARAKSAQKAQNLSPAYPIMMVFHGLMEALGRVPLWQDVEEYLVRRPELCLAYYVKGCGIPGNPTLDNLWTLPGMRPVRYRIASTYYSFLREVHTLLCLRHDFGLDALYHPLQDAEWKSDIVCGLVRVEIYLLSAFFKGTEEGRKVECQSVNPGVPVVVQQMETSKLRGKCWLHSKETIEALAEKIVAAGGAKLPPFKD
jgi:hypothetical protein